MISHHLTKSGVYFYRKSAHVQHKFNEALVKQMYQELLAGNSLAKVGKARNVSCDIKLLNRCRFSIRNAQLHDSLIKQGCVPNKSLILTFPDINVVSEDLVRHFIRGYFDGDGCLSFNKNKYCTPNISILGTKQFLEKLETISNFK